MEIYWNWLIPIEINKQFLTVLIEDLTTFKTTIMTQIIAN